MVLVSLFVWWARTMDAVERFMDVLYPHDWCENGIDQHDGDVFDVGRNMHRSMSAAARETLMGNEKRVGTYTEIMYACSMFFHVVGWQDGSRFTHHLGVPDPDDDGIPADTLCTICQELVSRPDDRGRGVADILPAGCVARTTDACGHTFHTLCLLDWARASMLTGRKVAVVECPVCRNTGGRRAQAAEST